MGFLSLLLMSNITCFSQAKPHIEYMRPSEYVLTKIDSISLRNYYMFTFSNDSGEANVIAKRQNHMCSGVSLQLNKSFILTLFLTGAYKEITKDSTIENGVIFLDIDPTTIRVHRELPLYGAKEICNDFYIGK